MIIQCEGCKKRLKVDDSRFIEDRLRCACPHCKRIMEVQKPESTPIPPEPIPVQPDNKPYTDWKNEQDSAPKNQKATGLTIGKKLLLLFLTFILITGSVLTFVYMTYVPSLMHEQIDLRTYSISQSFSGAIQQPLLIKNYLLVNQMAASNAKLPGVAYVSVLNKRGIVIAGILSDNKLFDAEFRERVKGKGFPKEISSRNRIPIGLKKNTLDFTVGGQKIHDVAVMIGDTGGEAHVGVFTADVEKAVQKSLIPLLALLVAIVLIGSFCFYMVARTISTPIKALTLAAEKISSGEINHPIKVKGGGEIGELANSLERMRFSINTAMDRLRSE
ncbi:MAG: HAMP domain-containing protein [Desulfobacteraceae bacterium]|nr:HAMP domain-containing protein [Desulfobacteraceae bacterium]